jgi:AcrR family transcriptional regulator
MIYADHQTSGLGMASKDQTRLAILVAAEDLFARFGPLKTSVADIARAMGMSAANIYNFYPSRDAIMEAVGTRHLMELRHQITDDIAREDGDWARIAILFVSTAHHLRKHLENEKNILQLQELKRKHKWQFVEDFYEFLHKTANNLLQEGIKAGRLADIDPEWAIPALFDCMASALEPILLSSFSREDHVERIESQLRLLERAFR